MECSFEERKRELELECILPTKALESAAARLEAFLEPFVANYRRRQQAMYATTFVQGLCSDLEDKNSESIAYLFGLDRKTIQHFIGESNWNDKPLREELVRQVGRELGEEDGVIVLDPSAFPKSGKQSVGVARQWCGRLGKVDNCQVGLYLGYVSSKGHVLVDTELYLPKAWTKDKQRLRRKRVPKDRWHYRNRHELFLNLLDRHRDALPHKWITGDDELGRPARFRRELRERNECYLLAVPCNTKVRDLSVCDTESSVAGASTARFSQRVDRWVADRSDEEWTPLEVRDAEKGPITVEAIKRPVETGWRKYCTVTSEVLIVIRYRDRDSHVMKTDYYLSNADFQTPLAEYCRAAKAHQRIEECFQRGKGQAGMADYEVRNWPGWQHHQTLALLASWFLNVETRRAEKKDTRHNFQPSSPRHRFHPSHPTRMRYAPRCQMAH